jgi:acyl dehydratase
MLDRSQIGRDSGERVIDVDRSQVRLFCQAIGETDPVFLDDAAAKAAGHPASPVPPTFVNSLNFLAPAAQDLVLDVLQAPLGRMLHGEQRFFYERPVYVGDRIRLSTRIADIYDKKGGALEFIVLDTTFHNQRDELCATMRSVAVLRH